MKKQNFFLSLLDPNGSISSKRFAGLLLIATAIAGAGIAYMSGNFTETAESVFSKVLYTGGSLLGMNMVESVMKTVAQPKPVKVPHEGK